MRELKALSMEFIAIHLGIYFALILSREDSSDSIQESAGRLK
jgi:hypothetical protein